MKGRDLSVALAILHFRVEPQRSSEHHHHHQDYHQPSQHSHVESVRRRVHVKDLHEAKLVENCAGGNYLQSLLLHLTCSVHPDFTWDYPLPTLSTFPCNWRGHLLIILAEGIEAPAKILSLFSACSTSSYISKNLPAGGCAAVTN